MMLRTNSTRPLFRRRRQTINFAQSQVNEKWENFYWRDLERANEQVGLEILKLLSQLLLLIP